MMDIVERLRQQYTIWNNPPSPELPDGAGVVLEAADEITRLRAENERLREALKAIQNAPNHAKLDHFELVDWMSCAARAALHKAKP